MIQGWEAPYTPLVVYDASAEGVNDLPSGAFSHEDVPRWGLGVSADPRDRWRTKAHHAPGRVFDTHPLRARKWKR